MPKTRKLIADRGTTFANAVATDPVCCPARATLLTGMYPHNTDVFEIGRPGWTTSRVAARRQTIGVRLQHAGLHDRVHRASTSTATSSTRPTSRRAGTSGSGWPASGSHRVRLPGEPQREHGALRRTRRPTTRPTCWPGRRAVHRSMARRPTSPAVPADARSLGAARADRAAPRDTPTTRSPTIRSRSARTSTRPTCPTSHCGCATTTPACRRRTIEQSTGDYRNGLGSLLAVDEMVGVASPTRLKAAGELEDTVFVFTSDNGYSFGSHRHPREARALRGVGAGAAGGRRSWGSSMARTTSSSPTSTWLRRCTTSRDWTEPDDVDGISIVPFLEAIGPRWREDILIEFNGTYSKYVQMHTFEDARATSTGGRRPGSWSRTIERCAARDGSTSSGTAESSTNTSSTT